MRGLMVQLQVVHALILREMMTRFGTQRLGYLWAFIEPLIWIGTFTAMYSFLGRVTPPGMGAVPFVATGIVPFLLFRQEANRNQSAIAANKNLLFYPRIRPLDFAIARSILEFATTTLVFTGLMGGNALFTGTLHADNLLKVALGMILAAGLGIGLGMTFCALTIFTPSAERVMGPLLRPLFWISGVFYSVDSLPTHARDLLLYNPVLHAVQLVRMGCFASYESPLITVWYPGLCALILLFIGLTLERVVRRRIQLT